MQRREQPQPLTSFGKWCEFVRIPRVKLVLRNLLYLLYLLVYVLLFFSHIELDNHKCDSAWAPRVDALLHVFTLWTLAIFLDELHSASISFDDWHRSFWNWLDGLSLTIVFYSLALLYYNRVRTTLAPHSEPLSNPSPGIPWILRHVPSTCCLHTARTESRAPSPSARARSSPSSTSR